MEGLSAGQGPEGCSGESSRTGPRAVGACRKRNQEHTGGHNVGTVSTEGSVTSSLAERGKGRQGKSCWRARGRFEPVGKDPVNSKDPKVPEGVCAFIP